MTPTNLSAMELAPFGLEDWLDEHEYDAEINIGEGHLRGLSPDRFDLDPGRLDYVVPTSGDPEVQKTLAERYNTSVGEILCTCGTQEANLLAMLSVLGEDDHAVTILPTYQTLSNIPDAIADVEKVYLSPPDWEIPMSEVSDAIRPSTSLLVLDNPNNPTGKYHSEEKIKKLYRLCEKEGVYLLCDEGNLKFVKDSGPPVTSFGENGISTSSVTKPYGLAGARFGWLVADRSIINTASDWKKHTTISPPVFGQHIAKQAIEEQEEKILAENRRLVAENYDIVDRFVEDYELEWYPSETSTGFVTIPTSFKDSHEFCTMVLEKENVLLIPGDVFGYDDYFRIGFGISTEYVREGLHRVEKIIKANGTR